MINNSKWIPKYTTAVVLNFKTQILHQASSGDPTHIKIVY